MANANSTIEIELEIKQALDRLNRLERELQKSAQQMQKAADATGKLEGALNKAKTAAAGLFAFFSGQQIVEAADQFTNFANAVRISTSSVAEQTAVQKELYRVAQTTGSSLGDISKLYGRLRQAADQLGSSQAETIKITEIVGKALAASGTSASEASGALLQLAQALNSPRVQAEEFNSLVDAMPNLLRQVERQLGITAGGLKKFVTDGQLSNKLFRDAILGSAAAIDDQFGKANDTIATALTRLNNAFILLVGNFEESTGFFNKTAAIISSLAENMEELARVLKAVAVGFAIAFAPKVIRAIRDTATAMATLGAASKTNVIGALAALGFYIADITGGLDLLTEKLGLTKDASEETAEAIVDLTKVSGGGVAAIAPVVPVPSQSYLQGLENLRGYFGNEAATSERILQAMQGYSEHMSQLLSDAATKGTRITDIISGDIISFNRQIEESRHLLQLFTLAYEQALGREAGESANVLALQFLAAQQAMKVLLDLRDQELAVIAEVEARIAAINERGIERTESERIILRYQNEIAEVMADETFSLLQRERIVKALESARDRELKNAKEVLSFQEMITDELQTQLGLSESAASAAVSGYFGAGPSASRAGNILQSTSPEEAAFKLILSNEKVASAINEQFELLFDVIDPLIDILADLQSAINRLIKALLNAGQGLLDTVGLGQDSYLFGGGFAKDIESFFGGGGRSRPRGPTQTQIMALGARDYTSEAALEQLTADIERFGAAAVESYILGSQSILRGFADRITEIGKEIIKLGDQRDELQAAIDKAGDNANYTLVTPITRIEAKIQTLGEELKEALAAYDKLGSDVKQALNEVLIPAIRNVVDEINDYAAPLLDDFAETAGIEALATEKGISIGQARIQYINDEQLAILAAQTALAAYITDAEEQAAILAEISAATQAINDLNEKQLQQFKTTSQEITDSAIADIQRRGLVFTEQQEIEYRYAKEIAAAQENTNLTTADQIRLVNALEAARQREIDAIERSQYLLGLTQAQTGLAEILKTFQDAIQSIQETVEGLYDQAKSLLFSDFNLMPVMDQFQLASAEYQNLLEKAFSPDATEEDIENLQGFVNQYLTSAKDVFKSSSKFQEIFEGVLADLTTLGVNYGIVAPIGAAGEAREDIADLGEEFGISVEELITSLDSLVVAFTNQQLELVYNTFEVDISDQIFFTISEEGYIVEIPATSIEVSIAEDFSATATFTPEITGFSTSDEDTTGDYSGYASFDAELTGFGLTAEDTTGVYNGYSSFFANLAGMSADSENPQEYNGYSSFFANLTGMSEDSENPQEYNGYASVIANLAGMSEDSENPFEISGYSLLTATLTNMSADSENPFEISGYAGLTATLSNLSVDADDPYVLDGYARLRATLTNLTTSSIAPYILDAYASLRGWATNMSWDSASPYQLDAYSTLVANLTVDDSGFTSAWSSFQVAVTTAVNDFIDLLNAAIDGIESGEPIPTTLAEITYPARPTPGVSGAGVSASDYGTYNLAYKYSESSRGIVESLGMGIYDQIANPLESYVIQFSQGYDRYLFTFDDLTTAEYYYNLYAGDSPTKYGFRQGGLVPDPMDTIPAMLSPGEYILSPETVRRFGVSSLNQLNSGDASAISQTNDPEVKRLLAELIQAVRESDTEVNVYTDMRGQAKAAVEEFRSEIKERSRRQGDQFIPVRYI